MELTRSGRRFSVVLAVIALISAACTGAPSAAPATGVATQPPATQGASAAAKVDVEWFVGLGTGENEEQIPVERTVVDAFNAANPGINLILTVVDNTVAADTLATRIAANDAPDIIGPIGIRGLQGFGDQLLDLAPYIESSGVDLSDIDQSLIDAYNVNGKQIGIPMAVYSSFLYYNKDLFDEAELPYPPHAVGEQYEGQDWNWATVRELALQLTVDGSGNDATSSDFDSGDVVQYGLDAQFTENDARAWSTVFGGSGSAVAADGSTAQWPDNWRTGLQFMYDGIWNDHIIPDQTANQALADGNTFDSGRVAMDVVHQWYVCCLANVPNWDIAVLPVGPNGSITSKLHADTIGIMDSTANPEAAFEALSFLAVEPELAMIWGATPAVASAREGFFASLDERFAPLEVDWNVSSLMLQYPDNPSHEAFMPNFQEADSANKDLGSKIWTDADLDLQAEIDAHVQRLQGIFDAGG